MAGNEEISLNHYLLQTQRFIADLQQVYCSEEDLIAYVNRARREIAMRTQSVRVVSPVQGAITAIEVVRPGRGYRNPKVHISWPDMPSGERPDPGGRQARASAAQVNGRITNIAVEDGGSGYFHPQIHVYDADEEGPEPEGGRVWGELVWGEDLWGEEEGRGQRALQRAMPWSAAPAAQYWEGEPGHERAVVRAHTVPVLTTHQFQEVYPFKSVPLERFPGVGQIFAVKSISFIYMNYRYSVPVFSFSVYQAYVRIYPQQYLYVPTAAAQYGQGVNGSIYMYPIPSHMYQMEWDCFCLPQNLDDDQDFEAIPPPWTDAVPYFAAHLAYLGLQNLNAAQYYLNLTDDMCRRYSAYARPGRAINPYGRWSAFT